MTANMTVKRTKQDQALTLCKSDFLPVAKLVIEFNIFIEI